MDVSWCWVVCQILVAVFVFIAATLILLRVIVSGKAYNNWCVKFFDGFQKNYNARMHKRKQVLLYNGLHEMTKSERRNLRVLEVGAGAGANFQYFPDDTIVTCLDPEPGFGDYLTKNAAKYPHVKLGEFHVGKAEDMSAVASNSMDAVVCTLVLCTVTDVDKSLQEIRRVLKPGGKFFYLEHISANRGTMRYWMQCMGHPIWSLLLLGCQLTRPTPGHILAAGFCDVQQELFEADELVKPDALLPCVTLIKRHVTGVATK